MHPDTCIAALAGGGLLCVDPDGVKAFNVDGAPLLGVGERPRRCDLKIPIPRPARGSWRASIRPMVLTSINRSSRRGGLNAEPLYHGNSEFALGSFVFAERRI